MKYVPVIMIQMTETQRQAFSIADNKTAEIANWEFTKLKDILEELKSEEVDLNTMGFSDQELRKLIFDENEDEDIIPEIFEEPKTKIGDLIILGEHRLLCGDSRDKTQVDLLIDNQEIDHVFGGPPYFNQREYAYWEDYNSYLVDMKKIIENCYKSMKDGSIIVWNIANGCSTHHDHTTHNSLLLEEVGFIYLDTIIWLKKGANFDIPRCAHIKKTRCYYPAFQWEALLVFQKKGKMPKMTIEGAEYMSNFQTNVWEIPAVTNQKELYGHPAVCPVEIPYRSIQAYTGKDTCIFEPFGGSGTTLIAAEKTSRKARLMERNPLYCDMIIKRWETLTGNKSERFSI